MSTLEWALHDAQTCALMGSYANGIFEYSLLFASCGAFLLLFSLFINYISGQGRAAFIGKTILFVTAHPDDECMFFAPCIQQLSRLCEVHLLCLSSGEQHRLQTYDTDRLPFLPLRPSNLSGDYYGQGDDRKKELRESCGTLGIWPTNVSVIDHRWLGSASVFSKPCSHLVTSFKASLPEPTPPPPPPRSFDMTSRKSFSVSVTQNINSCWLTPLYAAIHPIFLWCPLMGIILVSGQLY